MAFELEKEFNNLRLQAARALAIDESIRDFVPRQLAAAVARLDRIGIGSQIPVRPDIRAKWERYVVSGLGEFTPAEVRQLCWDPAVVHSSRFEDFLPSGAALSWRALEGLGFCLQMSWVSGRNNAAIRQLLASEFVKERLSRRLRLWRDHRALLIDNRAQQAIGDKLLEGRLNIPEFLDRFRLNADSELFQQALGYAITAASERFDQLDFDTKRYVFDSLLKWEYLSLSILQRALPQLILAPALSNDKELQKTVIDMVLGHPKLGDPRIFPGNWPENDSLMRNAAEVFTGWLSYEDIRIFFEVLLRSQEDPHRRRAFWLDYVKNVRRSRVFVSEEDRAKRRVELAALEGKKRSFGQIRGATSAFILHFGHHVVVEFSEVGNAAYVYTSDVFEKILPNIFTEALVDVARLKNRRQAVARIERRPPTTWEWKARTTLADLRIFRRRDD